MFVGCSFCVRSLPVWRSSCVGSCGVRARRQIARRLTGGKPKTADCGSKAQGGGHYTGTPRAYYRLHTDGRRAGFGQTWTSPDVPRWAAADCAAHGLETDWRRVRDNARGCLRTLRVRLTPNLPSESIRFLRHIYHEYAQRTTHGRATDFPYRTSSSPSSPRSPRAKVTPDRVAPQEGADKTKRNPGTNRGFFLLYAGGEVVISR